MAMPASIRTESASPEAAGADASDVLGRLREVCGDRGLGGLSERLADLADLVRWDMKEIDAALSDLPRGDRDVQRGAHHLLDRGGKRLRPMCVALASRVGHGFNTPARTVAVAVELVHCATLLHDDVVDLGEQRRGAAASRTIYGNAASIFAGDWLLIEALRRVRGARVPGTLDRLLDIIEEMIFAESIQLQQRGRADTSIEDYFRVVEGKTAALFRWAMFAGARAGGLETLEAEALEGYGNHLGIAFQLVDDLLDYTGQPETTGKSLFADVREGKMTYPLLLARDRDPSVPPLLHQLLETPEGAQPDPGLFVAVLKAMERTEALKDSRGLAARHADMAIQVAERMRPGRARDALITVASATVYREK